MPLKSLNIHGNPRKEQKEFPVLVNKRTYIRQPSSITRMDANYTILQYKAIIVVIEQLQKYIRENINGTKMEQLNLFGVNDSHVQISIPLKLFGVSPNNYKSLKDQLKEISNIGVSFPVNLNNEEYVKLTHLFSVYVPVDPYKRNIIVEIGKQEMVFLINTEALGFTRYWKELAFSTKSKYTLRMYWLLSMWQDAGGFKYKFQKLKKEMGVAPKAYKDWKTFYEKVLKPAYDDLHMKSDIWFEVDYDKKTTVVNFKIITSKLLPPNDSAKQYFNDLKLSYSMINSKLKNLGVLLDLPYQTPYYDLSEKYIVSLNKLIQPTDLEDVLIYIREYMEESLRKFFDKEVERYPEDVNKFVFFDLKKYLTKTRKERINQTIEK